MLSRLTIRNYAIIAALDIDFKPGLTIITGETGAGKSILLGALSLALGKRADPKVVSDDAAKCLVEAHFQLNNDLLKSRLEAEELDYDDTLICRREISANGKSRSFINDTPVALKTLNEITSLLIELHHQHDNLALQSRNYQINLLDALSESTTIANSFHDLYTRWVSTKKQLALSKEAEEAATRKKEFIEFQLHELEQAKLSPGETSTLEETQNLLEHAESIEQVIHQLQTSLDGGHHAILPQLNTILKQVESVSSYFAPIQSLAQRLHVMRVELEDLALETSRLDGPGNFEPGKLDRTQQRLNQLYSLIKKYRCKDEAGLIAFHDALKTELHSLLSVNETIASLEAKIASLHESMLSLGHDLSAERKKGAKKLIPKTVELVHELGMPNARFDIAFSLLSDIAPNGIDDVQFLFSANRGSSMQPLQSVASGGELSRLSLTLKSIYASKAQLPTIVFDEIDTGISGEVAWRMGQLIRGLAKGHQILMITHSPQIAAHADRQYHVSKITAGKKDISDVKLLTSTQRIQEIAKMLSGDPPSKAAISNAESLLEMVK